MKVTEFNTKTFSNTIRADELEVGQLARITDSCLEEVGAYVLRTYQGIISLDDPSDTWSIPCSVKVELLPKGFKLILEQE